MRRVPGSCRRCEGERASRILNVYNLSHSPRQIVIDMELTRRNNDKQIAVVYFTMVSTVGVRLYHVYSDRLQCSVLFLLSDLDAVVDGDKHLEACLYDTCKTINGFGMLSSGCSREYNLLTDVYR